MEESQGCLPRLQGLLHGDRGCSEEHHGQPRSVGGNRRATERTVCWGEFWPEEANRGDLKSTFLRTHEA